MFGFDDSNFDSKSFHAAHMTVVCDSCLYNFFGICSCHSATEPDLYGMNIAERIAKLYPLDCSDYRPNSEDN